MKLNLPLYFKRINSFIVAIVALISLFYSTVASAEGNQLAIDALSIATNESGEQLVSLNIQVLLLMTFLTLLPAIILMMTSFTRVIIVLSILRQALGLQQTPSNQLLIGISLFMTFFIMSPVAQVINEKAFQPYIAESISFDQAIEEASFPVKRFMLDQTREDDLLLFNSMMSENESDEVDTSNVSEVPFTSLLPAFVLSELKTAFQIGFVIFIPFLVIDLVVASVLMAMGMMMLSPLIISLPFKLLLFVMVDGWNLIVGTLANSFIGS